MIGGVAERDGVDAAGRRPGGVVRGARGQGGRPPHHEQVVHLSTVHHARDNRVYNKEARGLVEAGFDLTLVITAARDEDDPVRLRALPQPAGRFERVTAAQLRAWRVLRELRPEVLQIHDPELIGLALAWRWRHGSRIIYDSHEDLVKQINTKPHMAGWRRLAGKVVARVLIAMADRHFDAIIAATESVAASFKRSDTVVVRNYPWRRDFATRPDVSPVPGRVVYAGDLSEERKLSFMCEVVRRARERVPEAHLVLAGRPLAGAQRIIDAQPDGVVSHVGLLPPTELPAFMASGQLGLVFLEPLPNYVTSLPTKLFEYMAAGIPFVASDFGFWRGEFGGFAAGRFVSSHDADADSAAGVVAELLAHPQLCRSLGANGRRAVDERLNFESQLPALTTLTGRLLGERRHRRIGGS